MFSIKKKFKKTRKITLNFCRGDFCRKKLHHQRYYQKRIKKTWIINI